MKYLFLGSECSFRVGTGPGGPGSCTGQIFGHRRGKFRQVHLLCIWLKIPWLCKQRISRWHMFCLIVKWCQMVAIIVALCPAQQVHKNPLYEIQSWARVICSASPRYIWNMYCPTGTVIYEASRVLASQYGLTKVNTIQKCTNTTVHSVHCVHSHLPGLQSSGQPVRAHQGKHTTTVYT